MTDRAFILAVMFILIPSVTAIAFLTYYDPDGAKVEKPQPTVVTTTVTAAPTPTETPVEDKVSPYGTTLSVGPFYVTAFKPVEIPQSVDVSAAFSHYKAFIVKVENGSNRTIPNIRDWWVDSGVDVGAWKTGDGKFIHVKGYGMPEGKLAPQGVLTFKVVFGYNYSDTPRFSFAECPLDEICDTAVWA